MAAKRLLGQPAPYNSSSEDDAVDNEEEEEGEEEEEEVVEKNGSEHSVEKSGEDIDEEKEDMEEDEKLKSPLKKKKPMVSSPNDSDNSSPRWPSLAGLIVEPTVSMSKPKKKAPAEPNNKREREPDEKDYSNKKRRKVAVAEDPKKASGVAVVMWSEEDEIALLKGMSHYKAKKGTDPNADMGAFHDFIKEKLNPDVTKYKLSEKIRRLKKKYLNNASKIEDDDEDPIFPKPHEL